MTTKQVQLSELSEFRNGKFLSNKECLSDGKYDVFGSNGIIAKSEKFLYEKPVIVIGRVGANCGTVNSTTKPSWITDNCIVSIPNSKTDFNFLFYALKILQLNQLAIGSAQPLLTQDILNSIEIPYITLTQQQKIGKTLHDLDTKIQNLQNQNRILEQTAQAIFQSWFVDFDGVTEFEDSELGKIPKGWNVKMIKEIAEFNSDNIRNNSTFSEIYYIDTSSVTEGRLTDTQKLAISDAPSRAKRLVKKNDILISTVRPNLKHFYFVKNPRENLVVSTGFVVIRPTKISPFHLYYHITSDSFTEYLTGVADSHTSAYPSFPSEIIENTKICLPDSKSNGISSKFDKTLNPIYEKLEYNQNQISSLTKTRDTLLPKLMLGEIRV